MAVMEKIPKKASNKRYLVFVILLAIFYLPPVLARAASLYFSPSSGDYAKGENFTVNVLVSSEQSINAISGIASFPTEYINIISVDYANSIVDLWVRKPSFSNSGTRGNISFEGVVLNPGFTGSDGKIISVKFQVEKPGSADLKMDDFSTLANDGLGTNIATSGGEANFIFTGSVPSKGGQTELEKTINKIGERIQKIEDQTRFSPVVVVQEVKHEQGILGLWEILPKWSKISILILVGIATILLILVIFGLMLTIIIWIFNYLKCKPWHIKEQLKRFAGSIKFFSRKVLIFFRIVEKEIECDAVHDYREIKENFHEAKNQLYIKILLRNYYVLISDIVKRLFAINHKEEREEEIEDDKLN